MSPELPRSAAPFADRSTAETTTPIEPESDDALARARVEAVLAQWKGLVLAIVAVTTVMAVLVWNAVHPAVVLSWLGGIIAFLIVRSWSIPRLLAMPPQVSLGILPWFSLVNGFLHGVPAWAFMPKLDLAGKALITMFLVAQAVTSIPASAFYLRSHRTYSLMLLAPLCMAWITDGGLLLHAGQASQAAMFEISLGLLLVPFFAVLDRFARRSEQTFVESFRIRDENTELVRTLQTERAALAQERDRAEEASRAKTRFLAAASHDLRQPIHALSLLGGALSLRPLDNRSGDIARHITQAIDALGSQFDALLDVSKLDAGVVECNPRPVALAEMLGQLVREIAPAIGQKRLRLECHCPVGLTVQADPSLLERVLRNLLDNAMKYTDAGGISMRAARVGETVRLEISDTGRGIPRAEQKRVFEEFYQLDNPERDRARGLGLGLAIVRRLVDLLGVDLDLQSAPGAGTTVTVMLPAVSPVAVAPAQTSTSALKPLHALVIDDEVAVRIGMQTLLEELGCRVSLAASIDEAKAAAAAARPDVVLADFRLRGKENGIDAVYILRAEHSRLPAILITGDTDPQRLRQAHAAGLPLLHKPVKPDELKRTIAVALGGADAQ